MTMNLEVAKRADSAAAARTAGNVPGVVYGPKQEPIAITADAFTFTRLLHEAGESTIVTLTGLDEEIEVLIHDVAFDAAKGGVEHVDFYAIERGKELTTNVALEYVGEAAAEKAGNIVNRVLHEVEVTCRPSVLPSQIDVDMSGLAEIDDQLLVSDLVVAEGVTINTDATQVVVSISAAREEEVDADPEAVDMDAVEVEGEKAEDVPAEDAA